MIAGDTNINALFPEIPEPTTTTATSCTLNDHIIVSHKVLVKHTDVLPCHTVSNHDGPHCSNEEM